MKTQWQIYKELEQIPNGTFPPSANKLMIAFYQSKFWQNLVTQHYQDLSYPEKVEFLQHCLQLNNLDANVDKNKKFGLWQIIWAILNQPIHLPKPFSSQEPYVWTSCNHFGQLIWHIFDPKTGNTLELDSEEQVLVWLEKRHN